MAWEIVVGIETHTQLLTKSKMFSGASTAFGAPPNSQACAVDVALPGVLPVGLQIMGYHFAEARMLGAAHQYQRATDWHRRVPKETPL